MKNQQQNKHILSSMYFGLGTGFAGWFCILLLLARIPFVYSIFLVVFFFGILYVARKSKFSFPRFKFDIYKTALITAVLAVVFLSVAFPLRYWDSRVIWNLKARIIFVEKTVFSEQFLNPEVVHPHVNYPLMLPVLEAWLYNVMNSMDDYALMLFIPLFYIMLLSYFYGAAKLVSDKRPALVVTSVLAFLPGFFRINGYGTAYSGYADVPLSFFFAVSFISLYLWNRFENKEYLVISSLFSGFCALTKNEGLLFCIANVLLLVLLLLLKKIPGSSRARHFLIYCGCIVIITLPHFILEKNIMNINPKRDEFYAGNMILGKLSANAGRSGTIAKYYFRELFVSVKHWGLLWYALVFSIAAAIRKGIWNELVFVLPFVLYLIVTCIMYVTTVWDPYFLMDVTFSRLLLQVAPSILFLIFVFLTAKEPS